MDLLLILIVLAVFLLPSFFMMRSQRKRQAEILNLQNSLNIGDRVVTTAGMHGTVTGIRETELDLELTPGVEVTMEKASILRHAVPADEVPGAPAQPGQYGEGYPGHPENPEPRDDHGHPENPR